MSDNIADLVARLEAFAEHLVPASDEYADEIATLRETVEVLKRQDAIVEDKLADTRLISAGPKGAGEFGFDLMGGPIPYIAEYLFQFIGARDEDKPTSNYAEIEVNHHEFGAMTLHLQRHTGQTPHALRQAAESRAQAAEVERDRLKEALKRIDTAFDNATRGKGNPERDLGWTGSSDNWGQILSWFAREALRGEKP